MEDNQLGREKRRMGEKVQGLKSIIWQVQNRENNVNNRAGNVKPKNLHACSMDMN